MRQLNYYKETDKYSKILDIVNNLLNHKSSDREQLYFIKGYVYEQQYDSKNAILNYKNAITLDNDYFDAYFNLGVLNYNSALHYFNIANEKEQKNKSSNATSTAQNQFIIAKKYFEKANEIEPLNSEVSKILMDINKHLNPE